MVTKLWGMSPRRMPPIGFAHRGARSELPENTLPAFEAAVRLGYRYLETDVQATADGVLLAFHDDDLQRTCGVTGRISEMPWSKVSEARVHGREPIPLFADLVEAFPEARLNIDCKTDAALDPLAAALKRHHLLDRVCIGSFSHRRLARLRLMFGSELCTAMSPSEVARWVSGVMPKGAQVAQVPVRQGPLPVVTGRSVERAHRHGIPVHVWTIDDAAEMHRLLDLGIDGLMTDRPTVLRDVLVERGAWH